MVGWSADAFTNVTKVDKEGVAAKGVVHSKAKTCCGYPLSQTLGFKMTFYWLAIQKPSPGETEDTELYTMDGYFFGSFSKQYVRDLKMEGSGILADGRVVNWAGKCNYGVGTCFEELNVDKFPYGRGVGRRPLVPFRSIAVDPRIIPYDEPVYIPEIDGMVLPDGSIHDGCVRADDTGGWIKRRHVDFFVVTKQNYQFLLDQLWGLTRITPHIEDARCEYLRRPS